MTTTINRLEFDIRKLREVNSVKKKDKLFNMIGRDRFQNAFDWLSKNDPVEAATICLLYYSLDDCKWNGMLDIADVYKVSSQYDADLKQKFWNRLKEKGMDKLVLDWHAQKEKAQCS